MSDRLHRIEELIQPVLELTEGMDPQARKLVHSWAINAADAATSPIRSCGGECVDCRSVGRVLADSSFRVCDKLEELSETVYREADLTVLPRSTGDMEGGAFF